MIQRKEASRSLSEGVQARCTSIRSQTSEVWAVSSKWMLQNEDRICYMQCNCPILSGASWIYWSQPGFWFHSWMSCFASKCTHFLVLRSGTNQLAPTRVWDQKTGPKDGLSPCACALPTPLPPSGSGNGFWECSAGFQQYIGSKAKALWPLKQQLPWWWWD